MVRLYVWQQYEMVYENNINEQQKSSSTLLKTQSLICLFYIKKEVVKNVTCSLKLTWSNPFYEKLMLILMLQKLVVIINTTMVQNWSL